MKKNVNGFFYRMNKALIVFAAVVAAVMAAHGSHQAGPTTPLAGEHLRVINLADCLFFGTDIHV